MKTVAVISEYDPFHRGHMRHISEIRREFGDDTAIIAIMGGDFTQRGELAASDAFTRAEAAVAAGVQLVLKIPFPFSSSSAQFFAQAGVSIADRLGVVDVLSFGSESGDLDALSLVAKRTSSEQYLSAISANEYRAEGHAKTAQAVYRRLYGDGDAALLASPNDTLAIEYLRALLAADSSITPHTVKRAGAHGAHTLSHDTLPSATAIRLAWQAGDFHHTLPYLPEASAEVFLREFESGNLPVDQNRLSSVVLTFLRSILPQEEIKHPAEDGGGLYRRICNKAEDAPDLSSVITASATKKYTTARIRRLIWYALFGITSSALREKPAYAQILALDGVGASLLRRIRRQGSIELLTKPADYRCLSPEAVRQAELDLRAERLYFLAKPVVRRGDSPLRRTPHRKG